MILIFAAVTGTIILVLLYVLLKPRPVVKVPEEAEDGAARVQRRAAPRGAGAARARLRTGQQQAAQGHQQAQNNQDESGEELEVKKMGAKKAAKLEAKAEKKSQREADEREREERKKRQQQADEERKKQDQQEALEEKRKEEEARKIKEEQERKEYEEYLKIKATFTVEEEGCEEEELDEENLLHNFITYIQDTKVVALDELAARFRMKTQAAIDRVHDLLKEDRLSGVIDERGKFIYISKAEMEGVAKFIKQRGRVSLAELAENSSRLITLTPKIPVDN